MTDLEYDLHQNVKFSYVETEYYDAELNYEKTANNLSKLGYQKIVWHNEANGTYLFSFDGRDINVPKGIAQTIVKANDNYLNSIFK